MCEFGAALQHAGVRHPRIEPDVERVAGFVVVRSIVAQQFGRVERKPGLDAGRFDALRHYFQQLRRARVQFAGFLVGEEGIGTPQLRWRETHQSGRFLIIASSRARPHEGKNCVASTAAIACSRRVLRSPLSAPIR